MIYIKLPLFIIYFYILTLKFSALKQTSKSIIFYLAVLWYVLISRTDSEKSKNETVISLHRSVKCKWVWQKYQLLVKKTVNFEIYNQILKVIAFLIDFQCVDLHVFLSYWKWFRNYNAQRKVMWKWNFVTANYICGSMG